MPAFWLMVATLGIDISHPCLTSDSLTDVPFAVFTLCLLLMLCQMIVLNDAICFVEIFAIVIKLFNFQYRIAFLMAQSIL